MQTTQIVEALLFASDAPLTAADLARADESLDEDAVEAAVQELRAGYEANGRSFQIYEVAGGYQIMTLPDFAPYLERFATVPQSSKLSQAALEALAVIAYRQPIDRSEIEEIRGVASSGVLRTLQDRALIDVVGRGEGLGRPMLYGTTAKFMEHFGFRSLDDLPRSEELPVVLTGIEPPARRADDPAGLLPGAQNGAAADDDAEDDAAEAQAEDDDFDDDDELDDDEFGAEDDVDGPVEDDLAELTDDEPRPARAEEESLDVDTSASASTSSSTS